MCRVRGQFLHLESPSELTKITITDFHYREGSVSAFGSFRASEFDSDLRIPGRGLVHI